MTAMKYYRSETWSMIFSHGLWQVLVKIKHPVSKTQSIFRTLNQATFHPAINQFLDSIMSVKTTPLESDIVGVEPGTETGGSITHFANSCQRRIIMTNLMSER